MWKFLAVVSVVSFPVPAPAQQEGKVPVARGFWIDQKAQCSSANYAVAYDGINWGRINSDSPALRAGGEMLPILKASRLRDGFVDIKTTESGELSYERVRPIGPDRVVQRLGTAERAGFDISDNNLKLCHFAQLSASMQAVARKFVPRLAVANAAADANGRSLGGMAGPLNIRPGYYVDEESACTKPFDVFYFDGNRFGYYPVGNGRTEVQPTGPVQNTPKGWELRHRPGESPTLVRVLGPDRIQMYSGPPMRWCPAGQLPAARRPF